MRKENIEKIKRQLLNKRKEFFTTTELQQWGISKYQIAQLCEGLHLKRLYRGIYRLSDTPFPIHPDWIPIFISIKKPVICLISALSYHNLTLHFHSSVDVALPKKAYQPKIKYPPIRYITYPQKLLNIGTHIIKNLGWSIQITNREKTLIDCLVFEDKLTDNEIIPDAFRMYFNKGDPVDIKKLERYAKQFGVLEQLHFQLNQQKGRLGDLISFDLL